MQPITFLTEFIKHPRNTGAIAASTMLLVKEMVSRINFENAQYIIELGPGTGSFTREIMRRKKRHTTVILIENNKVFYNNLQKNFDNYPNVYVVYGSAENVIKYIKELNIDKIDYVISSIPFLSLPMEVSNRILTNVMVSLKDDGKFITYQYSLLKKCFIQNFFPKISVKKVWFNFPPAYVFSCLKE
jgi:phosphatidylethanolamine/phosphatidyl-N-methylethanolamine N-methyltransferase